MLTFLITNNIRIKISEQWIRSFRKINLHLGQTPQNAGQILKNFLVENGMEIKLKEHEYVRRKKRR